jgi:hypothetical protein
MKRTPLTIFTLGIVLICAGLAAAQSVDPLPSWHDGAAKQSIIEFVENVTKAGSPDFVPAAERIAVFDNDGTLWAERPMYFQLLFALDRVQALAPRHPEWQEKEPFASLLKGDVHGALADGMKSVAEIIMATHAGMTTEEFETIASDWIATAHHPTTKRPLHRDGLPADARAARLPARQRFQNLYRVRRRHRVHAPVDRESLRDPP